MHRKKQYSARPFWGVVDVPFERAPGFLAGGCFDVLSHMDANQSAKLNYVSKPKGLNILMG